MIFVIIQIIFTDLNNPKPKANSKRSKTLDIKIIISSRDNRYLSFLSSLLCSSHPQDNRQLLHLHDNRQTTPTSTTTVRPLSPLGQVLGHSHLQDNRQATPTSTKTVRPLTFLGQPLGHPTSRTTTTTSRSIFRPLAPLGQPLGHSHLQDNLQATRTSKTTVMSLIFQVQILGHSHLLDNCQVPLYILQRVSHDGVMVDEVVLQILSIILITHVIYYSVFNRYRLSRVALGHCIW